MPATTGKFVTLLPAATITTAGTVTGAVAGGGSDLSLFGADYIAIQAVFTYGSGGATAKAYVQTTLDEGATWIDVACFAFTTASATKVSALTGAVAPASQAFAPSDGALADNTIIQGVLGDQWRVKLITTGAYATSTTLAVTLFAKA